jgi:DNA-binding MarR family transcriptional regulator
MQIASTRSVGYIRHDVPGQNESGSRFSALFVIAGSRGTDSHSLRRRLGLSEGDFRGLIDQLQRGYLVDIVSERQGGYLVEHIHLTEEGKAELQQMLESMCELPELE